MIDVYAVPAGIQNNVPQFEVVELQMDEPGLRFAVEALSYAALSLRTMARPPKPPRTIREFLALPEPVDEDTARALGKRLSEASAMEYDLFEAEAEAESEDFQSAVIRGPRVARAYEFMMTGVGEIASRHSRGALFPGIRRGQLLDRMLSGNLSNHVITLEEHQKQVADELPLGAILIDGE